MIIFYSKSCAFLWVADFRCLTAGSANPNTFTAFHRWRLCLTIIGGSFTEGGGGGGLSLLVDTRHIFSLSFPSTVRIYWTLSHLTEPTQSYTKHSVDSLTMHSHPFNAISPCICKAICHCLFVPCHMYDECYMNNFI